MQRRSPGWRCSREKGSIGTSLRGRQRAIVTENAGVSPSRFSVEMTDMYKTGF